MVGEGTAPQVVFKAVFIVRSALVELARSIIQSTLNWQQHRHGTFSASSSTQGVTHLDYPFVSN